MLPAIPRMLNGTHPCFYAEAKGKYGRIHLPVAPSCNIQCCYCRRELGCQHESRPGVTNGVLSPEEACGRLERMLTEMPHVSVAAVAGPGDAFCDPERTLRTFELIRKRNRDIALCVSTNGLNVSGYIPRLRDLDVGYVTITINAIDPLIGARLCKSATLDGATFTGFDAARLLISRQLEALSMLKSANFTVKVNSVVVTGVNDHHVLFLAKKMGEMRVDLMNFVPLIPVPGTDMEGIAPPCEGTMRTLRLRAGSYVSQMHHCTKCRSDAAGLLRASGLR